MEHSLCFNMGSRISNLLINWRYFSYHLFMCAQNDPLYFTMKSNIILLLPILPKFRIVKGLMIWNWS